MELNVYCNSMMQWYDFTHIWESLTGLRYQWGNLVEIIIISISSGLGMTRDSPGGPGKLCWGKGNLTSDKQRVEGWLKHSMSPSQLKWMQTNDVHICMKLSLQYHCLKKYSKHKLYCKTYKVNKNSDWLNRKFGRGQQWCANSKRLPGKLLLMYLFLSFD